MSSPIQRQTTTARLQLNGQKTRQRSGFSLLEMMLALAILGTSLAVLADIAGLGVTAAREAQALVTARMICQNKLTETLLNVDGGLAPTPVSRNAVDSYDSDSLETFYFTLEINPGEISGLLSLRGTVEVMDPEEQVTIATYSIDRWIVDPDIGLIEMEQEELAAREEIANGGAASGGIE